jgi:hypothetical protein
MIFGILGNTLTKQDLRLWQFQAPEMIKSSINPKKANTPSMAILNPASTFTGRQSIFLRHQFYGFIF